MLTEIMNPDSMGHMKTKTFGLILSFFFFGSAICFAADPHMGTWKLNEAKSKITPGTAKFTTVTIKNTSRHIGVTADDMDANGNPMHDEWSGKFDGKDYRVNGDPNADTHAYRKVDERTLGVTTNKQ